MFRVFFFVSFLAPCDAKAVGRLITFFRFHVKISQTVDLEVRALELDLRIHCQENALGA